MFSFSGSLPRKLIRSSLLLITLHSLQADWLTFGHDPQRTGWAREETKLSPANVGRLQLAWTAQLDNLPLALNALTAPVIVDDIDTPKGKKNLLVVAGSSNGLFAVDTGDGSVLWTRTFGSHVTAKEEPIFLCPNAVNATPVIDKERRLVFVIAFDGKLYGLDLATGDVKFGPFQFVPAASKTWSLNLKDGVLYTTTSQACGGDRSGIYAMHVDNPMHIESHELVVRRGFGGGMWSRGGPAIGRNNLLYASTGDGAFDPSVGDYSNSFVAVTLPTLDIADYFTPLNWKEVSKLDLDLPSGGHLILTIGNHEYVIGGGKESVVYVLDANSLGGPDHGKPAFATPALANEKRALEEKGMWGAPAAWTDETGQSWVYVTMWGALSPYTSDFPVNNGPTPHGSILAFRANNTPAGIQLQPAWISPDIDLPDAPVIANGVLFAVATGENPRQVKQEITTFKSTEEWKKNLLTTEERGAGTHSAVLYALDAKTGKPLYNSGNAMKSWVHFSGLAVSNGQVYTVDHDSRVYCFRLP